MMSGIRPHLLTAASVFAGLAVLSSGAGAADEIFGPNPKLPAPESSWFPTVNIAPAVGWKENQTPKPADGLKVSAFATGLEHPRWLYTLPNGDVLVAETNAQPKDVNSIRGFAMKYVMGRAGAGVESPDRISLLRDADKDGRAETRTVFIDDLTSPFGMALVGDQLYVANTDALMRFTYTPGQTEMTERGVKVADLPAGERNHHWTKNLIASRDGKKLFVTVGSNSNVAENGMEEEKDRAAILEFDIETSALRVFASGLRNPNGMDFKPGTDELWTVVNERDEIGDNLVPDYLTSVRDGGFYGWPYSYFGDNVDTRVTPQRPDLVAKAIVPDYALGAHTASLGLMFAKPEKRLGAQFADGVLIGQHGSWNRAEASGYKVIFVPFANGKPTGQPIDVLTGFVNSDGEANGRPVGVAYDASGALLVADDVGNIIWRVVGDDKQAASTELEQRK